MNTKKKNVLIVLCGLPASGKSTYAEMLVESGVFQRVCPDLIHRDLYGNESIQGDSKKVFGIAHRRIKEFGENGKNCVFDATNIDENRRTELVKEMRPYFDILICKFMYTPLDYCLKRNKRRERQVPEDVIQRMHDNFDFPTMDEGWDYVEEIKNY